MERLRGHEIIDPLRLELILVGTLNLLLLVWRLSVIVSVFKVVSNPVEYLLLHLNLRLIKQVRHLLLLEGFLLFDWLVGLPLEKWFFEDEFFYDFFLNLRLVVLDRLH